VANTLIKADQIVDAAVLLLQREIVLPRLVYRMADATFVGAKDDTITLRVPAVLDATARAMRSETALVAADLAQTSVPVKLDTHVYQLLNITDEELTLDITNFASQILAPQMRAVAEGMEDVIATALAAATWEADPITFVEGTDDPYDVAVDARKALNDLDVPRAGRVLLLGSSIEAAFLKSDRLSKVNESGSDDALRDALITRVAGFTVVGSNALDPDVGYAFHQTAVAFGNVAPALPEGATMKSRVATDGLALRYLRDYNPTNATGPVDRSLVDAFVGAVSVEEGAEGSETNKRGVAFAFTGAGS
jgi:hypothetical protein